MLLLVLIWFDQFLRLCLVLLLTVEEIRGMLWQKRKPARNSPVAQPVIMPFQIDSVDEVKHKSKTFPSYNEYNYFNKRVVIIRIT